MLDLALKLGDVQSLRHTARLLLRPWRLWSPGVQTPPDIEA
jgi:hypothetical protein